LEPETSRIKNKRKNHSTAKFIRNFIIIIIIIIIIGVIYVPIILLSI